MNLIKELELILTEEISKIGYSDEVKLNVSNRPTLGDYQYNGPFNLAKVYHESPSIIADKIVESLINRSEFKNVSNANGFVNLTINEDCLISYVNKITKNFNINTYKIETDETIFLDV